MVMSQILNAELMSNGDLGMVAHGFLAGLITNWNVWHVPAL